MKNLFLFLVLLFSILDSKIALCLEKTSTGFYWPTGNSGIGQDGPWLASGCFGGDGLYTQGSYHTGRDMNANLNDPVYAISDGEVVQISQNGWGHGNIGVFIRHRKSDGGYFWALYGHLITNITVGKNVNAGQKIGEIGYWEYGNHLHFGIYPNNNIPPAPYGIMPCASWPSTNGFVDPVEWIKNKSPYGYFSSPTPIKFTDSKTVYYYSNNQLWPILNEAVYTLLGFRKGCTALIPDWNRLVILPATSRSSYSIRSDVVGSPGLPPGRKISYRVNSATCLMGPYDPTKLYALLNDNNQIKFRHITDWDKTYKELGYDMNGRDIVDIPYEFLQSYGEGESIGSSNINSVVSGTSAYLAYSQVSTLNYSRLLTPPYNIQADTVDNQSIQLTWTLPNGTDDYNIKIYRNGVLLKNFSAIDSVVINGLSANTTYCFQASLFCNSSGEESAKSAEVCATTNINPPPPPINWTIANERVTTQVNSSTYQPIDEKYSYEKSVGKYLNYWVKLDSNNSGLNFEWRLFYTFDNSRVWNAQTSSYQPAYLCQKYSYFDSANQNYYIWHKIEANTLPYVGQYRIELWIDGQKASSRCFDLTLPAPDYFRLDGIPTQALTSFRWLGLGDNSVSGSGVELFMDNNRIAFIPGYSNGYTIASNVRGTHDFRIREVNVYPAGTFRSPFSAPLSVMVKLNKVTGTRITN